MPSRQDGTSWSARRSAVAPRSQLIDLMKGWLGKRVILKFLLGNASRRNLAITITMNRRICPKNTTQREIFRPRDHPSLILSRKAQRTLGIRECAMMTSTSQVVGEGMTTTGWLTQLLRRNIPTVSHLVKSHGIRPQCLIK